MNKVILMGRLTRDPEVRYSQGENSSAIARYTLAVDRRFRRNNDGEQVYTTDVFIEEQEFAESKSNQGNNSSSAASVAKPTPNPNPSAPDDNGFMNIPDGLDEELPFN